MHKKNPQRNMIYTKKFHLKQNINEQSNDNMSSVKINKVANSNQIKTKTYLDGQNVQKASVFVKKQLHSNVNNNRKHLRPIIIMNLAPPNNKDIIKDKNKFSFTFCNILNNRNINNINNVNSISIDISKYFINNCSKSLEKQKRKPSPMRSMNSSIKPEDNIKKSKSPFNNKGYTSISNSNNKRNKNNNTQKSNFSSNNNINLHHSITDAHSPQKKKVIKQSPKIISMADVSKTSKKSSRSRSGKRKIPCTHKSLSPQRRIQNTENNFKYNLTKLESYSQNKKKNNNNKVFSSVILCKRDIKYFDKNDDLVIPKIQTREYLNAKFFLDLNYSPRLKKDKPIINNSFIEKDDYYKMKDINVCKNEEGSIFDIPNEKKTKNINTSYNCSGFN